jgi:NADH:ubiquinone oxidoreductase subunit 2 (subunit N)
LLFVVGYALAVSGAFLTSAAVRARRPDWDGTIAGLAGLAREAPVVSLALSVLLFSMTGIPPLLGFWGKFLVFLNAASTDLLWLVIIALLGSVVSFGYYGRVMRVMYFEEPEEATGEEPESPDAPADSGAAVRTLTELAVVALAVIVVAAGAYLLVFGLVPVVGGGEAYGVLQLLPFGQ